MSTTLQHADTSVAPEASGRHMISPLLLVVLIAAVLWIGTLRIRRRRAKRLRAGDGKGTQDR
jgi:membrane protein DedA with SNARE-associated domain